MRSADTLDTTYKNLLDWIYQKGRELEKEVCIAMLLRINTVRL